MEAADFVPAAMRESSRTLDAELDVLNKVHTIERAPAPAAATAEVSAHPFVGAQAQLSS